MGESEQNAAAFEYPPLHGGKLLFLTAAIATASFMEILDMTIVNVSVPAHLRQSRGEHIGGHLGHQFLHAGGGRHAAPDGLDRAALRRGHGPSSSSILLFMCFSAVCGLATSLPMLVGARLIQGLVSGPMMSVAQAILLRNYPIERRGMAIALWSMVIVVAPICGPIIGGWITDNLVLAVAVLHQFAGGRIFGGGCWSILRHRESKKVKLPIDAVGLVLLVVGVGSLQFMLDNGNEKDWFNSPHRS